MVKALVLEVCSLQGPMFNISWVQTIPWGHIPWWKANDYPILCRETSKGAVHETDVYFAGMGLKGSALQRFPDIKKKKKNSVGLFGKTIFAAWLHGQGIFFLVVESSSLFMYNMLLSWINRLLYFVAQWTLSPIWHHQLFEARIIGWHPL